MPMPSEAQIRELLDLPYPGSSLPAIATLRLAIAAERIADALEGMAGVGDPPPTGIQQDEAAQSTAPDQLHTRIGKGWIHGVVPFLAADHRVKVYDPTIATGWELRDASLVTHEDLWAPLDVDSSPLFKELPLRRSGPQPEPQPVASLEGWRTGCPSAKQSSSGFVEVRNGGQQAALPDGRAFRVKHRLAIGIGEHWAPINLVKSFLWLPPVSPGDAPAEPC